MTTKICSKCGIEKPISAFSKRSGRKCGVQSRCKSCTLGERAKYDRNYKQWYANSKAKDPTFVQRANLKRNYGMTLEEFNVLLEKQDMVCKVCKGPALGKGSYHVDHDHLTGKIRGLLCHKCNVALGMVQDKVELLNRLIQYLQGTL